MTKPTTRTFTPPPSWAVLEALGLDPTRVVADPIKIRIDDEHGHTARVTLTIFLPEADEPVIDPAVMPTPATELLATEVARLKKWKDEAGKILSEWDKAFALVPDRPSDLGRSNVDVVTDYIYSLQTGRPW